MKLTLMTAGSYVLAKCSMLAADLCCESLNLAQKLEHLDSVEMINWLMQYFS